MANISTLTVSLVAETAKFENGLKRSRKQASQFSRAAGAAFKVAGVGAVALAGSLSILTKRSLALVDQQRKAARVLGATQAQYAGIALAADVSGVSLESVTKALKRQQKSITDAVDGLSTQARAFDRLGLEARELLGLPVEQQFQQIVNALGQMENQTLKVAAASDIFGAKNADLLNILELGEDGLSDFIKKADELNLALTEGQTKAIEDANDAVTILKASFTGIGNQIAAQLAPAIKASAERIVNLTKRVGDAIPRWAAWARSIFGVRAELNNLSIQDITEELKLVDEQLLEATGLWREQQRALEAYTDEAGNVSARGADLAANLEIQGKVVEDLNKRYNDLIRKRLELRKAIEAPVTDGLDLGGDDSSGSSSGSGRRLSFSDRFPLVSRELEANLALFDEWERRATSAFDSTRTASEALQIKLRDIATQLRENPFFDEDLAQREARAAIDAYIAEMNRLEEKSGETFESINEFARQAGANIQDDFSEFLFDPFDEGLDGMLKSFVTTLRKMVANLLAQKLLTSFFGFFPGLGQVFGFNPGTPSVPGRRIGGPVGRGQSVQTAEGAPEVFTPGASGAMRPLGAISINQEVNFNGGNNLDPGTLIPILEDNNRKLKSEILDEFDRGAFI